MAFQMRIDEMLDALVIERNEAASELSRETEALADKLAAAIAKQFGIQAGKASFQGLAFAGTCVPFYGEGDLPEALASYDDPEEFCEPDQYSKLAPEVIDTDYSDIYPISDWQAEVAAGDTKRGYDDWVLAQIELNTL